jgi:hypothetical protein
VSAEVTTVLLIAIAATGLVSVLLFLAMGCALDNGEDVPFERILRAQTEAPFTRESIHIRDQALFKGVAAL